MESLLNAPLAVLLSQINSLGFAICEFTTNKHEEIDALQCKFINSTFAKYLDIPINNFENISFSIPQYDLIAIINSEETPPLLEKNEELFKIDIIKDLKHNQQIIIIMQCVTSDIVNFKAELAKEFEQQFYHFANNNTLPMMVYNLNNNLYFNNAYIKLLNYDSKEDLQKKPLEELSPLYQKNGQLSSELLKNYIAEARDKGFCLFNWTYYKKDRSLIDVEIHMNYLEINKSPLLNATLKDLTEQRRIEENAKLEQERIIDELSIPIMPIFKDIILVSLIGTLTEKRANLAGRLSLQKIAEMQSRIIIIDVSGVNNANFEVAVINLLRLAGGAYLMNCRTILTGLSPELARGVVETGIDITGVIATANLEEGLKTAIKMIYN